MFNQLIGNDRVKELLGRMLESQRVPGALLFSGEEGIGKKLFALEVARALNCRQPQGVEACGVCPSCKRIGKFNFPQSEDANDWKNIIWTDHGDVGMVVAPKRVLLVDQMRQIEKEANFRPFEGKSRIFLIDEADKLNEPSANALLKVLEEPPPTSHLVLITARPAMLLPTIRSRCQMIRFSPLTPKELEQFLLENKISSPKDVRLRARLARGSIGRALSSDLDGFTVQRDAMLEVLNALVITDDRGQLLRSSEQLNEAAYKDEYETRLDVLETLIRDSLALAIGARESQIINADLLSELTEISKRLTTAKAAAWITQIEELREQLIVNINKKIATDSLLLTMATT
jgi:DNA polymerase III subunit delta'